MTDKKYSVIYSTENNDLIATLFENGKQVHKVNVDHILWEHFYKNGWIK